MIDYSLDPNRANSATTNESNQVRILRVDLQAKVKLE